MLTNTQARMRVADGAAFLDSKWPEWFKAVEVNTLDMGVDCACVLGQLDGSFEKAVKKLWPENLSTRVRKVLTREGHRGFTWAVALGFDVPDAVFSAEREVDFDLLQNAWVEEIASRRCRESAIKPDVAEFSQATA